MKECVWTKFLSNFYFIEREIIFLFYLCQVFFLLNGISLGYSSNNRIRKQTSVEIQIAALLLWENRAWYPLPYVLLSFQCLGLNLGSQKLQERHQSLKKERRHKVKKEEREIKPTHSHQKRDSLPIGKS